MSKPELLDLLQLLSALESWGFSTERPLPDYLADRVCDAVEILRREVMK